MSVEQQALLFAAGDLNCCACLLSVHDLRQQMVALQSQLQQVQLERAALTSKLKASQAEISSLQNVRQWYQQQLALAQEARVRLQGEMAHIQVWPLICQVGHAPYLWKSCFFPKLKRPPCLDSINPLKMSANHSYSPYPILYSSRLP